MPHAPALVRAAEPAPLEAREAHPLEALLPQFNPLPAWDEDLLFPPATGSLDQLPINQRQELLAAVRSALLAAFPTERLPSPAAIARARTTIAQAQALAPSESRVAYAAGLVALAAEEWTEAEARFAEAVRLAPPVHAGALMGTIYARLASHDPAGSAEACRRLARGLANAQNDWPGPRQAAAFSLWLGRAAAGCDHLAGRLPLITPPALPTRVPPVQAGRPEAQVASLRDELPNELPERLVPQFLEGYDSVAKRLVGLQPWLNLNSAQLRSETASLRQRFEDPLERLHEREQRLEGELTRLKQAQATALRLSAKPLSELTRQLAAKLSGARTLSSQLDSHQRKYNQLAQQIGAAETSRRYQLELERQSEIDRRYDPDRHHSSRARGRSRSTGRLPPP
ncbi:MAG: hypothetical protein ACKO3P_04705, partial [Planctomycetaceae bacterium]